MQVFFSSREQARKAGFGVMFDNGKEAEKGKRFARSVEAKASKHQCTDTTPFCHSANFDRIVPVFVRGKNKL